jgi:hypothetical protein
MTRSIPVMEVIRWHRICSLTLKIFFELIDSFKKKQTLSSIFDVSFSCFEFFTIFFNSSPVNQHRVLSIPSLGVGTLHLE